MPTVARRPLSIALAAALACPLVGLAAPAWADPGDAPKTAAAKAATKKNAKAKDAQDDEPKKAGSRAAGKHKKAAKKAERHARPCLGDSIAIDRTGLEAMHVRAVDCHRQPSDQARLALSVLARPWGAKKPDAWVALRERAAELEREEHGSRFARMGRSGRARPDAAGRLTGTAPGEEIAPGVRLLDRGLLTRLDAIARRFPGRPISIVSGYRPQSRGSQHQSARALDLRVTGVPNEKLVAFCKTLRDTGCGYYPNSSFVHVDVRYPGTGTVSWIDASGPGEGPHYVPRWPPPAGDADRASLPIGTGVREPAGAAGADGDPWNELEDQHPASPR
jgi:hypothetical protein